MYPVLFSTFVQGGKSALMGFHRQAANPSRFAFTSRGPHIQLQQVLHHASALPVDPAAWQPHFNDLSSLRRFYRSLTGSSLKW